MSPKPLQAGDTVFYWQEDKPKLRSDGRNMVKRQSHFQGSMVGLGLGTQLIKIDMTKVRMDERI